MLLLCITRCTFTVMIHPLDSSTSHLCFSLLLLWYPTPAAFLLLQITVHVIGQWPDLLCLPLIQCHAKVALWNHVQLKSFHHFGCYLLVSQVSVPDASRVFHLAGINDHWLVLKTKELFTDVLCRIIQGWFYFSSTHTYWIIHSVLFLAHSPSSKPLWAIFLKLNSPINDYINFLLLLLKNNKLNLLLNIHD